MIKVNILLEDETKVVLSFSTSQITWEANNHSDAVVGTSALLGQGIKAHHYQDSLTNAWHIQAKFN